MCINFARPVGRISSRHSDSGGLSAEDVKSDSNKCMKMGLGHPCMYARMQVCMDGCIHFLVYGLTECLKKNVPTSLVMSQKVIEPDGCTL